MMGNYEASIAAARELTKDLDSKYQGECEAICAAILMAGAEMTSELSAINVTLNEFLIMKQNP